MSVEFNSFDEFVDDLLESDENLLKGELDLLLMQHIFNSIDLNKIEKTPLKNQNYIAAQKLLKFFYNNFWYPVFGKLLLRFVHLIEGKDKKDLSPKETKDRLKK